MDFATCKNCEMNVVPSSERICPSCGLNVDIRTTTAPSSEERVVNHRKVLRNAVWVMTIFASLPAAVSAYYLASYFGGSGITTMRMDAVTIALIIYSFLLAALSFACSIMVSMGMRAGRAFAYIPACLILLNFPIGTLIGVYVLLKLNNPVYLSTLK